MTLSELHPPGGDNIIFHYNNETAQYRSLADRQKMCCSLVLCPMLLRGLGRTIPSHHKQEILHFLNEGDNSTTTLLHWCSILQCCGGPTHSILERRCSVCGHYCGGRYRDLTHHQSSLAGSPCGPDLFGRRPDLFGRSPARVRKRTRREGLTRKTTTCNVPPLFRTDTHCRNSPILPVEVVHVWYAASSNKYSCGTPPHWTGTLASQYYRVHEAFHAANPPTSTLRLYCDHGDQRVPSIHPPL